MSVMDDLYREHILDHYKNPRNHGTIDDADVTAEGVNPLCGDQLAIDLKIAGDGASRTSSSTAAAAPSRRRRRRC